MTATLRLDPNIMTWSPQELPRGAQREQWANRSSSGRPQGHSGHRPLSAYRCYTATLYPNKKGSRSERSEESEDPPKADRSSIRVRIAQRDGDAGETDRARGWPSARQSEDHRAL